jgi:diguanylate cyclase (GGDEF)-like protein/PAS domain S-box-containing protein
VSKGRIPSPQPNAGPRITLDRGELEKLCIRNLLGTPGERIFFKDSDSRFLLASENFLADQTNGCDAESVVGKSDFDFFSDEHARAAYDDEQRIIQTGEPMVAKIERETFRDRPDAWVSTTKMPLRDSQGNIIGIFGISRDVTAQMMAEKALAHQALHDAVTGLPNRVALMDRLTQALLALHRVPGRIAVLFIDIDNFKSINDSLGHEAGRRMLIEIGRRLTRVSRRGDTVARLGGDEFVLLCTGLRDGDDVRLIASRAVRAIGKTFVENGQDLTVTGSIGVAVTSDALAEPGMLLQQADIAMYGAKGAGRDCFRVFDADLHTQALANHDFDAAVRKAIENKELFLMYQPLFSLKDRQMLGVEALVRWNHPERGVVVPSEFIPLAEERGLISAVDSFILDEACRQLAIWLQDGVCSDEFTVAVNISGRQMSHPEFVEQVSATIRKHKVPPSMLCLEITETALIGEIGEATSTLAALSKVGVKLALDDFGTGYSTLAHVQRLDVDILKIDRSFVDQIGGSDRDREIIGAITAMAHALGMSVVGEGIETNLQLDELTKLGCDIGQGFLLARPVPPDAIAGYACAALGAY